MIQLRLIFKKLYFFQRTVKTLEIIHIIDEKIRILNEWCEKIVNFFVFTISTDVRAFLEVIKIIKKWISNFFELERSLTRLTEKLNWRWIASEQLSFEILRVKCFVITLIHEIDYFKAVHFYTDAFMYEKDLIITQFRKKDEKALKMFILYDAFIFRVMIDWHHPLIHWHHSPDTLTSSSGYIDTR
jgi:hypothetical protein